MERGPSWRHHSLICLTRRSEKDGGREGLRWANRAERKSTKSTATNKTLGPLTWCELKPSSVSLHLRHQIMIPCCSATQQNHPNVNGLGSTAAAARKSLGVVSLHRYLKWRAEPPLQLVAGRAASLGKVTRSARSVSHIAHDIFK